MRFVPAMAELIFTGSYDGAQTTYLTGGGSALTDTNTSHCYQRWPCCLFHATKLRRPDVWSGDEGYVVR